MAIYTYTAKRGPTEIVSGEIEVSSEDAAIAALEAMGLFPVNVVEKKTHAAESAVPIKRENSVESARADFVRLKTRDVDMFIRQLAGLVKSSVPLLRALALIAEQSDNKEVKKVLNDIERQIKDGKMLSEAMEKYPRVFNNLYINMIRAGERSGSLDEVLYRLALYREKEEESRQRVQAAMAYPLVVLGVGCATIFIMLTYFLPKLTGLFVNMKQALPLPTRLLFASSKFMSANWPFFLIVLAVIAVFVGRVKAGSRKKLFFDTVLLYLPFVKKFVKNAEIVKFSRSLAMLLKNGIPVYESLGLAANTVDNDAFKEQLKRAEHDIVNQGLRLSESFKKANVFPPFTLSMIIVGEEGGRLEEALGDIADVYEREVDQAVKIITSLLEPALILIVGGVVGFIVFAMLLPIFNIGMAPR